MTSGELEEKLEILEKERQQRIHVRDDTVNTITGVIIFLPSQAHYDFAAHRDKLTKKLEHIVTEKFTSESKKEAITQQKQFSKAELQCSPAGLYELRS